MTKVLRNARRVAQTFTTFSNGAQVLRTMADRRNRPPLEYHVRNGPRIACPNHPGARVPVYEVFAEDAYTLDDLLRGLPDDITVLDIGAHIGCFAVSTATRAPGVTVHSIEASPSTAGWLRKNIALNNLESRVVAHNVAVSDRAGTIDLIDNDSGSSLNRLDQVDTASDLTTGHTVSVPSVTLAEAFAYAEIPPTLVKIDTEGAEYAMVLGSDPSTWASVQRVVIEFHPVEGHSWQELEEFFSRAGLALTRIDYTDVAQGTAWLNRER